MTLLAARWKFYPLKHVHEVTQTARSLRAAIAALFVIKRHCSISIRFITSLNAESTFVWKHTHADDHGDVTRLGDCRLKISTKYACKTFFTFLLQQLFFFSDHFQPLPSRPVLEGAGTPKARARPPSPSTLHTKRSPSAREEPSKTNGHSPTATEFRYASVPRPFVIWVCKRFYCTPWLK